MRPWTALEVSYLIRNNRRLTQAQMAAALGRTTNMVAGKRSRLGLTGGSSTGSMDTLKLAHHNDNAREYPYLSEYLRGDGLHQVRCQLGSE